MARVSLNVWKKFEPIMKSNWVYLSHFLDTNTPSYGNGDGVSIERVRQISKGDSSNNTSIQLPVHIGTHIDSPYHFDEAGKTLDKYDPGTWVFSDIHVIEYEVRPGELLGGDNWLDLFKKVPETTDLLLVKTGFEKYRKDAVANPDDSLYIFHNPGWMPEAGIWLRENRSIRAIGFDFISLSSYENREIGREAHRAFLKSKLNNQENVNDPILIIEDMKLSSLDFDPDEVVALPLMIMGVDGAPVTIIAR